MRWTEFNEAEAAISPDVRWLAYSSDESGRWEIHLQSFPEPSRKRQVSREGGDFPVWARNGRELFQRNGDQMLAVSVQTTPGLLLGAPKQLFEGAYRKGWYDVAPDGRFVMIERAVPPPARINVVFNWVEELKRLVPTN